MFSSLSSPSLPPKQAKGEQENAHPLPQPCFNTALPLSREGGGGGEKRGGGKKGGGGGGGDEKPGEEKREGRWRREGAPLRAAFASQNRGTASLI